MRRILGRLSNAVEHWADLAETPAYRATGVVVGLVLAVAVGLAPAPVGLEPVAQRTAAVAALMAVWWVARVLPMAATAMVPLVAFPVLGIMPMAKAATPYAHHLLFLMLGGFVIGHAMETVGLQHRLVATLLSPGWVRASPRRILLALMVSAAVMSALVSNTATTLMLLPLAMGLARRAVPDAPRQRSAFVLGLAYAASIGGVATLVGTPPNAVLAAEQPQLSFATWMAVGVPFVIVALPAAWFVLSRVVFRLPGRGSPTPAPVAGPVTMGEWLVIGVVVAAMLAWLTRSPVTLATFGEGDAAWTLGVPGWGMLLPVDYAQDALVAIAAALVLVVLPNRRPAPERGLTFLLDWRRATREIPWSVLLLLGGGFSLAAGIKESKLTLFLAEGLRGLGALTKPGGLGGALPEGVEVWTGTALTVLAICLVMTFLTELTSNTATTQITLPVLAGAAALAGVEPLIWMVPATISASCAFMMPVATAPNAIAAEAGEVAPGDMALAGLVLNLVCVGIAAAVVLVLVPLVF